jgi:hypothetical protein
MMWKQWRRSTRCESFRPLRFATETAALRRAQSASAEELRPLFGRTLMPSILNKAFRGEL